ncbi:efflux RND transporter permease subunit [Photobacterium lutimaris]|nr:efflux RND transporter permease subunit [Photobacterium lutimaris]
MPKRTLWWLVALTLVLGAGLKDSYFEGDYRIWFNKGSELLAAIDLMEETYSKSDNVMLVLTDRSGNIFTEQGLDIIAQMTDEAWQIPYSTRVDSITNYQYSYAEYDDLIVTDLYLPGEPTFSPQRVKEIAQAEPALMSRLVSDAPDVTSINVTLSIPLSEQSYAYAKVADHAREMKEKYQQLYPNLKVGLTGMAILNHSFNESALMDMATLVPAMLLVIFFMLAYILRSLKEAGLVMLVLACTLLMVQGVTGWLGISINSATANTTTLILTLSVADCIHILSSFHSRYFAGAQKKEAMVYAIKSNLMPLVITSITTAVGFLTLNFSDSPPIRNFGNIVAIGMVLACLVAIFMLPSLYLLCNIQRHRIRSFDVKRVVPAIMRRGKTLFWVSATAFGFMVMALPNNEVNNDLVRYFSPHTEFRQTTDYFEEKIAGLTTIEYSIIHGEPEGINAPEFLTMLEDFTLWLRQQPETNHVYSLSDTYKRLNMNIHNDDQGFYQLPTDRELAAQYLLLYELSLPFGLDLTNQVNMDKSATRVIGTFNNVGSTVIVALELRSRQWFSDNYPQYAVNIASGPLMFAHVGEANMTSMLAASGLSLIIISFLVGIALRSWKLSFILLVPTVLPAAAGFGVWGLIDSEVNMGISMVSSMTFGIIVDFCVHIASRYVNKRHAGEGRYESLVYAYEKVLMPITVTTLVLCAGFSMLLFSNFRFNSGMGAVTVIVISMALLVNVLLLPQLLNWFGDVRRKGDKAKAPSLA